MDNEGRCLWFPLTDPWGEQVNEWLMFIFLFMANVGKYTGFMGILWGKIFQKIRYVSERELLSKVMSYAKGP